MTISTGAFDSFGIPQGLPNRLDDLADVDALEAKEGNTIHLQGGRWVPGHGNEVAIQPTQPEDIGVELWVNPDEDPLTEPVDTRYVAVEGDTMTGPLEIRDKGDSLKIVGDPDYPEIVMQKAGSPPGYKQWRIYLSGPSTEAQNEFATALSFVAENDDNTDVIPSNGVFRMYRDGKFRTPVDGGVIFQRGSTTRYLLMRDASNSLPGIRFTQDTAGEDLAPLGLMDPGLPEHAATKNYVDVAATITQGTCTAYGAWSLSTNQLARKNGWVMMRMGAVKATASGIEQIATLPVGFRPEQEWSITATGNVLSGGGLRVFSMTVDANGLVRMRGNTYPLANEGITIAGSWPT